MPRTSATGTEGFTLVELLVVVAIVGIVLVVAAVNLWPNDEETATREAGLVALSLERARDAAWFGGRPTAVSFEPGRVHRWLLNVDRSWQEEAAQDRNMPAVAVTALDVDGQPMPVNQRLIFLADGFGTPFRVQLEVRGRARAIEGDAAGAIRVVKP